MINNRLFIYSLFLFALPLVIAWYDITVFWSFIIVLVMLLCRWGITLSGLLKPEPIPELQLDTISASHFVEKVRWSMDILGLDYTERPTAGIMGLFFTGRTVPQLKVHTGYTQSIISNSSDILRFLWGKYGVALQDKSQFLSPTKERLALEEKVDEYGVNLQVWGYYHILEDKKLSLQMWGKNCDLLPAWQRRVVTFLFPLLRLLVSRAFKITDKKYAEAQKNIKAFLSEIEQQLSEKSRSILSANQFDYVDIAFASISGIWLLPEGYGGGKADGVKIQHSQVPKQMRDEVEQWQQNYPKSVALIHRLYEQRKVAGLNLAQCA